MQFGPKKFSEHVTRKLSVKFTGTGVLEVYTTGGENFFAGDMTISLKNVAIFISAPRHYQMPGRQPGCDPVHNKMKI